MKTGLGLRVLTSMSWGSGQRFSGGCIKAVDNGCLRWTKKMDTALIWRQSHVQYIHTRRREDSGSGFEGALRVFISLISKSTLSTSGF